MDEKQLPEMSGIDAEDWVKTPLSVRQLVVQLGLKIEQLEQHLKELQDSKEGLARRESQSKLTELP
jgi:transposase